MNDCHDLQEWVQEERDQGTMVEYAIAGGVVLAGQPQPEDWAGLARRGFSLVVNIRSDPDRAAKQAANASAAGLRSIHLPLPTYELEPPHLERFQEALEEANGKKALVHCRTASRTALLWMLKRIVYDGWSREEAEAELAAAGYGDEDMDVFNFCADDYFERTVETEPYL